MSGRRQAQVKEDARLFGQGAYIYEAGACLVLDGEEHWLTGEMVPGELTIAEQIESTGAPALLLERYPGRLEYHEPWHLNREVSHLFRGLIDAFEADELLAEHGHGALRLVDNGVVTRRSPDLAALPHVRGYHLVPKGASKAAAVALHMRIRGYAREETFAVGDSREDLACAEHVGSFWLVANAVERDPSIREAIAGTPNVRVAEAGNGPGVYEAVDQRADGVARRRGRPPSGRSGGATARRQKPGRGRRRHSAGGGTVVRTSATHSCSGSSPAIRRPSALVTGAPTPACSSARASSGTDSSASTACPICAGISAAGTPPASSSPARRLRLSRASAVATRSPAPARPIIDSGRAPRPSAKRHTSAKMCPAAAPAAFRPCASVAPAASAAAFLAAPASSTPTGSFDCSQTTPARVKICASERASPSSVRRGDQRGTLSHHLLRVSRPAEAGDALGAEAAGQDRRRQRPGGRHEPLRDRDDGGARAEPGRDERVGRLGERLRRHGQEHVVGARGARRGRLDAQLDGELDPRQVGGVLARALERGGLLGGPGLQRRPQPAARQQHRQRGAERSGPDDRRAAHPRAPAKRSGWPSGRAGSRLGLVHLMPEPTDPHIAPGPTPDRDAAWRNWAGDQVARPARRAAPASVEELAGAVGGAREAGLRVRVVGAGHSFSDIALTDGLMVGMERMNRVLDADRASGLVKVQAGITIGELGTELDRLGLAMENLGDIDVQSIAGAISTATHGTGARLRNISSQVAGLTLVLADGSTLECSEQIEPEAFRAARVGLGSLGAIAEVTLRCVPAFTLRGVDAPAPLAEVLAGFEQLALENDHFEFFVFPHADVALTRTNNRTDEPPRPRGRLNAWANDILLTNHALGALCRIGRRFPDRIPQINRLVTKAGRQLRARRALGVDLRKPAARALHRDGVRAAARAHAGGGGGGDGADPARRLQGAVPDRGPDRRRRRGDAEHGGGARQRLRRGAHVRGDGVGAVLQGRGGRHGSFRRAAALGQAPLPDRRHAAPALPGVGCLPGRARAP